MFVFVVDLEGCDEEWWSCVEKLVFLLGGRFLIVLFFGGFLSLVVRWG